MSKIHYTIEIDSGKYTESDSSVGLQSGVFRFVTDGYNPIGDITENGRNITETWYDSFLVRDGIGRAGQRIDITQGGAFSNMNGFDFTIVNKDRNNVNTFLYGLSQLTETYLVGSKISLYIIIDGVMYDRWKGIIAGFSLSDNGTLLRIGCEDDTVGDFGIIPPLNTDTSEIVPIVFGDSKYNKVAVTSASSVLVNDNLGVEFTTKVVARITPNAPQNNGYTNERGFTQYPDPDVIPGGLQDDGIVNWKDGIPLPYAFGNAGEDDRGTDSNYLNGYTYILIYNNPNDYGAGLDLYKDKYVIFSDDKVYNNAKDIISEDSKLYLITKSLQWGNDTQLYLKECPDFLVDRTQMYGGGIAGSDVENLPTEPETLGEIIPEGIKSFIIVNKTFNIILSNRKIKEIVEPTLNIRTHFPTSAIIAYTKGNDSDTDIIKIGVETKDFDNSDSLPSINLKPNKVNGKMIDSYMSVYPSSEPGDFLIWCQKPDSAPSMFVNTAGEYITSFIASPNIDIGNSVFINIGRPYNEFKPTKAAMVYKKCNIRIPFYMSDFNPNSYDSVSMNLMFKKADMDARVRGGGPFDVIWLTESPTYPINTSTGYYSANPQATRYQIEVRTRIGTSVGDRYTQNYNQNTDYIVNAPSGTDISAVPVGETATYTKVVSPLLVTIPYGFLKQTNLSSYISLYPRQMAYRTKYQGGLGQDAEINLVDGYYYDTANELEIDTDLFRITNKGDKYLLTCSITPFSDTINDNMQWDRIQLYTPSLLFKKEVDLTGDLFLRMKGEQFGSVETNTLPYLLFHLVLSYGGNSMGFNNLLETRSSWFTGRQLTEQNNSFNYIKELCEQSFIVGYRTRNTAAGKYQFKAFLEESITSASLSAAPLHDSSIIVRNSIKGLALTPITKVYNEIAVNYDYNAITQKFDKAYSINNIDDEVFPDSSATWQDNVQGINSYIDAKQIWTVAHENYLTTKVINKLPDRFTNLHWASDRNSFYDVDTYNALDEYAYQYFLLANDWCTKQKYVVSYDLPITSATVTLNVMDLIKFTDIIATNNLESIGWIIDIALDAQNNLFKIKTMFNLPSDIVCGNIIESNTNTDIIIEDETNIDIIDEDCSSI